jgi:uncharacterized protein (TIGR02145 family)
MNKVVLLIFSLISLVSCENRDKSKEKKANKNMFEESLAEKSKNNTQKRLGAEQSIEKETYEFGGIEFSSKNLNAVTFRNGEPIKQANSKEEWLNACRNNIPAYIQKKISDGQVSIYYNWSAIKDIRGIAPEGWHIPNSTEFSQFIDALGYEDAGKKMKSSISWTEWENSVHCSNCKNILWIKPSERGKHNGPCGKVKMDGNGTNSSNFNGQPNGYVYYGDVNFSGSLAGYWVLGKEPISLHLTSHNKKAEYRHDGYKEIGYNVRCFKDNESTVNQENNKLNFDIENDQNGTGFKLIKIGNQFWMAQNLDVDKFRNGSPIKHAKTAEEWIKAGSNKEPAWCYYENNPENKMKYGKLYNSYALTDQRGLAPIGWHIPTDDEWSSMVSFLDIPSDNVGKNMKLNKGWLNRGDGTNTSGFSGVPGGTRRSDGVFYYGGEVGSWWSIPKDWYYGARIYELSSYLDDIQSQKSLNYSYGFSVRCIKD